MRRAGPLETVAVVVPEPALDAYEAALATVGESVSLFLEDEAARTWRVEAVRPAAADAAMLNAALALAEAATGVTASLERRRTDPDGWLARTLGGFPEQRIGQRFTVRGTHLGHARAPGRIAVVLDAGLAFGSGEHGSTRGCLRALEMIARRRPRRILDMGTGSGILAIAAARLLRRPVLALDNDPWSIRVARRNARGNHVAGLVRCRRAEGWRSREAGSRPAYDLVLANILARPLCAMAAPMARRLAPGGTAILSGLLDAQAAQVLAAHRRAGLALAGRWREGTWTTLAVRRLNRS